MPEPSSDWNLNGPVPTGLVLAAHAVPLNSVPASQHGS
jgi:hypothetical protein